MLNVWPENSLLSQHMNISPNVTYLGIAGEKRREVDDKEWQGMKHSRKNDIKTEPNPMISFYYVLLLCTVFAMHWL